MKSGDVVRLKSGGPKMTVETAGPNGNLFQGWVRCVWITEEGKKEENLFFEETLKKVGK